MLIVGDRLASILMLLLDLFPADLFPAELDVPVFT
tara:strand:+ start:370782 stop:370886 length:105 start_codon:yes stop_codon:yes gene_type:complete